MFDELSKTHEVHVFSIKPNKVWPEMPHYDGEHYDLGIINHAVNLIKFRKANIGRLICTSHGIVYVSVSEEVQASLAAKGYGSVVIRNPIDTNLFVRTRPIPTAPAKVLVLSNNPPRVTHRIARAIKGLKLPYQRYGGASQTSQPHLIQELDGASHVISLGRGCYEAMSMERNVIVMDYNGADGIITPESMLEFRKNNCSGRRYGLNWSEQDLQRAIMEYDPTLGPKLREYIIENNNVVDVAQRYLAL